eukprot:TRINITY_DN109999_c0_g1_i1.p1 TRINITY_DN109999_c0_g1~~TRINITY_DN109999_c0_g1_i1.p1  ORF type:complete len:238 (-),score=25.92 TRINITY_DN109999_c0_g1_i1:557-1270(-)
MQINRRLIVLTTFLLLVCYEPVIDLTLAGSAQLDHRKLPPALTLRCQASQIEDLRDLREGEVISLEDEPYEIIECIRNHPASMKAKLRNLNTGIVMFRKLTIDGHIYHMMCSSRSATFSWFDEDARQYVFIDKDTFEEVRVEFEIMGEMGLLLSVGTEVDFKVSNGKVLQVGINTEIIDKVVAFTHTPTGSGGNLPGYKRFVCVQLASGLTKKGPHYLKIGDKVALDPKTGKILRRV